MMNRLMLTALIWMLSAILAACGGPAPTVEPEGVTGGTEPPAPTVADLDGSEWLLASLHGSGLIEGTNITLTFSEGSFGGYGGCNQYGGQYTVADGGALTIPEMMNTVQLCQTPEGIMQQEETYLKALLSAATYHVLDDRLEIVDAAGETILIFARKEQFPMDPSALEGTAWQLLSLNGRSPIEGSTITIAFAEGKVHGNAGCRSYRGSYEASGDDIGFPFLEMTELTCLKPEAWSVQEGEYTDSLSLATDYRLSEGQLEIFTAAGGVLIFVPVPTDADASQIGATWTLDTFIEGGAATPLLEGTEITLTFDGDALTERGTVGGSAGCNTYRAGYTSDGAFFAFETSAVTEMVCSDPAEVMAQERRYLEFLKDVVTYWIEDEQLALSTVAGRALVYRW